MFVHVRPVDHVAAADDPKIVSLRNRCVQKARIPGEGYGDRASVEKIDANGVVGHSHCGDPFTSLGRTIHMSKLATRNGQLATGNSQLMQEHRHPQHIRHFRPVVLDVVETLDVDAFFCRAADLDRHGGVAAVDDRDHLAGVAVSQ